MVFETRPMHPLPILFAMVALLACALPVQAGGKDATPVPLDRQTFERLMEEPQPHLCAEGDLEVDDLTAVNLFYQCIRNGIDNPYWLAMAYDARGTRYLGLGRYELALSDYELALAILPEYPTFLLDKVRVLARLDRQDEAMAVLDMLERTHPDNELVFSTRGDLLLSQDRFQEAVASYEAALLLNPDDAQTLNNLAWLLATWETKDLRDGDRAITLAERAVALSSRDDLLLHLDTLAAAYAQAGTFDEAVRIEERALNLAITEGDDPMYYERCLDLYRQGKTLSSSYPD